MHGVISLILLGGMAALTVDECTKTADEHTTFERWIISEGQNPATLRKQSLGAVYGGLTMFSGRLRNGAHFKFVEQTPAEFSDGSDTPNLRTFLKWADVIASSFPETHSSCFARGGEWYFFFAMTPNMEPLVREDVYALELKSRVQLYDKTKSYTQNIFSNSFALADFKVDDIYTFKNDFSRVIIPAFHRFELVSGNTRMAERDFSSHLFSIMKAVEFGRYIQGHDKTNTRLVTTGPYGRLYTYLDSISPENQQTFSFTTFEDKIDDLKQVLAERMTDAVKQAARAITRQEAVEEMRTLFEKLYKIENGRPVRRSSPPKSPKNRQPESKGKRSGSKDRKPESKDVRAKP